VHLRERAMFALDVQHDPARALQIATENWQQQREPADVRVYVRAARLAHRQASGERDELELRQWLAATHYEDATLTVPLK
jgi:hypothetical protein